MVFKKVTEALSVGTERSQDLAGVIVGAALVALTGSVRQ